jgi:hypothetical protein
MSTNNEVGDELARFHRREDALIARAKAAGFNHDTDTYRRWQMWFADSETYLAHFKNAVEDAEKKSKHETHHTS